MATHLRISAGAVGETLEVVGTADAAPIDRTAIELVGTALLFALPTHAYFIAATGGCATNRHTLVGS